MIVTAGHWPAFWDARSGKLIRRLTENREFLTFLSIALDPVRAWTLMGSQDGSVHAWDLRTGQPTETSRRTYLPSVISRQYVDSVATVKDIPSIAYVCRGGRVRMWYPETEAEQQPAHMVATSNLVAGAQPHMLIFGTETGFVEVWDIAQGRLSRRYDVR